MFGLEQRQSQIVLLFWFVETPVGERQSSQNKRRPERREPLECKQAKMITPGYPGVLARNLSAKGLGAYGLDPESSRFSPTTSHKGSCFFSIIPPSSVGDFLLNASGESGGIGCVYAWSGFMLRSASQPRVIMPVYARLDDLGRGWRSHETGTHERGHFRPPLRFKFCVAFPIIMHSQ